MKSITLILFFYATQLLANCENYHPPFYLHTTATYPESDNDPTFSNFLNIDQSVFLHFFKENPSFVQHFSIQDQQCRIIDQKSFPHDYPMNFYRIDYKCEKETLPKDGYFIYKDKSAYIPKSVNFLKEDIKEKDFKAYVTKWKQLGLFKNISLGTHKDIKNKPVEAPVDFTLNEFTNHAYWEAPSPFKLKIYTIFTNYSFSFLDPEGQTKKEEISTKIFPFIVMEYNEKTILFAHGTFNHDCLYKLIASDGFLVPAFLKIYYTSNLPDLIFLKTNSVTYMLTKDMQIKVVEKRDGKGEF